MMRSLSISWCVSRCIYAVEPLPHSVCCSIILHRQFVGQFIGPTEAGISGFVRVTFHRGYSFHWRPCRQRHPIMPTQPCRFSVERTCRLLENQERPSHSKKARRRQRSTLILQHRHLRHRQHLHHHPRLLNQKSISEGPSRNHRSPSSSSPPTRHSTWKRLKTVQFLSVPLQRYGTTNRRIQIHSLCRASHSHRYPRPLMRLLPQIQCLHLLLSVRNQFYVRLYWFSTIGRPSTQ